MSLFSIIIAFALVSAKLVNVNINKIKTSILTVICVFDVFCNVYFVYSPSPQNDSNSTPHN